MSLYWTLGIGAILLLVLLRQPTPTQPKSGTTLHFTDKQITSNEQHNTSTAPSLRVASYNVQTGKSLEGKRNINAAANIIQDANLVGIQEVYAPSWLNIVGIGIAQTQTLAETGGFNWLFNATRRRWLREHRGNAILSKLPAKSWKTINLPNRSRKAFRNMTVLNFQWQGESIHFINTHLHTGKGRQAQLDFVLTEFMQYPTAILVGDFNSTSDEPALQTILGNGHAIDAIDVAIGADPLLSHDPNRIDWILTRGFNTVAGEFVEKGVSDHPYYMVELELDDEK